MKYLEEVIKNGKAFVKYVWKIDETKPKCWVEEGSYQYSFNKHLVSKEVIKKDFEVL